MNQLLIVIKKILTESTSNVKELSFKFNNLEINFYDFIHHSEHS